MSCQAIVGQFSSIDTLPLVAFMERFKLFCLLKTDLTVVDITMIFDSHCDRMFFLFASLTVFPADGFFFN